MYYSIQIKWNMHKAEYCELLLIVKVKLTADIKRILYNEFTIDMLQTCKQTWMHGYGNMHVNYSVHNYTEDHLNIYKIIIILYSRYN